MRSKGETFEYRPVKPLPQDGEHKLPNFFIGLIPLIIVFLLFAIVHNASLALVCGIISTIVLMAPYFKDNEKKGAFAKWGSKVLGSLNEGSVNGATAIMTLCAAAGFAAVVQHTEAFNGMVGVLFGLPVSPLVMGIILSIIVVAFTSSPPAALGIALPMVASVFIWHSRTSIKRKRTGSSCCHRSFNFRDPSCKWPDSFNNRTLLC